MKVIIDIREASLYDKCYDIACLQGNSTFVNLSKTMLPLGDILIESDENKPVMIIERKSLQDLLSSIKDGRYEEQSHRLIHSSGYPRHNIMYIVEGMLSTLRTPAEKRLVLATMTSLQYFKGFSVVRTCSVQETAEWIVWMADKVDRNFQKGKLPSVYDNWTTTELQTTQLQLPPLTPTPSTPPNYCSVVKKTKKENITRENIGEIMLCQIPGISPAMAIAIMKVVADGKLSTLFALLQNDKELLEKTMVGSRKLGKKAVENLVQYLL